LGAMLRMCAGETNNVPIGQSLQAEIQKPHGRGRNGRERRCKRMAAKMNE
jgi:hypothetical protein